MKKLDRRIDIDMFCWQHCMKENPHRWCPSPDAGPHWRCSECGEINDPKQMTVCVWSRFIESVKDIFKNNFRGMNDNSI